MSKGKKLRKKEYQGLKILKSMFPLAEVYPCGINSIRFSITFDGMARGLYYESLGDGIALEIIKNEYDNSPEIKIKKLESSL